MEKQRLRDKKWFIILLSVLVFPIGLVLLWSGKAFKKSGKVIVTAIILLVVILRIGTDSPTQEIAEVEPIEVEETMPIQTQAEEAVEEVVDEALETEEEIKAKEEAKTIEDARIMEEAKAEAEIRKAKKEEESKEAIRKFDEEKEVKENEFEEEKAAPVAPLNESLVQASLSISEDNMGHMVDITYEESSNLFVLTPTDPALISSITMLSSGDKSLMGNWDYLVDSFKQLSKSIIVPDSSLGMANPINKENTLLLLKDGEVLYDFTNEL